MEVDTLFFLFALVSVVGYGIHVPLITLFARRFDSLIVTVYRNLSFAIWIVPLFFLFPLAEIMEVKNHWPTLAIAATTGFASLLWNLNGKIYLPVGVSGAILRTGNVVFAILLGFLFFGEVLSVIQTVLLMGVLVCAVALSILRSQHAHLDISHAWKGAVFSAIGGIGVSISFFFFSILSREIHPLIASYFWETSIGVCALAYLFFQYARGKYQSKMLLPFKQSAGIAGSSLFVVIGTVCFAFAINHGPFSLATGIGAAAVLVATIISWFLFREKLRKSQVVLIALAALFIFLIKVLS